MFPDRNHSGKSIATIPNTNRLYKIVATKQSSQTQTANVASGKMSISEAHRKLGHVSCHAIKHAILNGLIAGIELDPNSKPEFCKACAKAKAAHQPFPKESKTRAKNFGEQVHWDLWGPASVQSPNSHSYIAACIDNAIWKSKLYFQQKKSQTFKSHKQDKAYIETQTGQCIEVSHSDQGGEFLLDAMIKHQNLKGTV